MSCLCTSDPRTSPRVASVGVSQQLHTQPTVNSQWGGGGRGCRCLGPAQVGPTHRPTPAPCHASCDTQTETMVWTFYLGIAPQNTKHTGLAAHLVSYTLTWKRLTFPGSRPASPGTAGKERSATWGQGPGCGARRSGSSPGSNTSTSEPPRPPTNLCLRFLVCKAGRINLGCCGR